MATTILCAPSRKWSNLAQLLTRRCRQFWRTLLYVSIFSSRLTAATFCVLGDAERCNAIGTDGVKSVIMLQSIGIGVFVYFCQKYVSIIATG